MKAYRAILVILVLAVFAAGCADGGGFTFDPGDNIEPPIWETPPELPDDPIVDDPEDPPADDPNGPVTFKPIEPPTYSADLPVYSHKGRDLQLSGDALARPYDSGVMEASDSVDSAVDCNEFGIVGDECRETSCATEEDVDVCLEAENHSITCNDVDGLIEAAQKMCDGVLALEQRCERRIWNCDDMAMVEHLKNQCLYDQRVTLGDIVTNSGCYQDVEADQDVYSSSTQVDLAPGSKATIN